MEPLYALYQQLFRRISAESELEFEKVLREENVAEVLDVIDEQEASVAERQVRYHLTDKISNLKDLTPNNQTHDRG